MNRFFCCVKGESSRNNPGNEQLNIVRRNRDVQPPQASSSRALTRYGATFVWSDILNGTSNLGNDFLIGQGNFGKVYRCNFPRINKVGAVKIQNLHNAEAFSELEAEIKTLHAAEHPNVVNLLGKCLDGEHRAIIYEFVPSGSLDRYIYADANSTPQGLQRQYPVLDWKGRLDIAIGVASALVYLHEELKMVHRDLKLANVLLDEDFVPKLTDFGLATSMVEDRNGIERQSEITLIKGTPGCIAPETEEHGFVSSKSDVYSYGVFLLTLFTGKKAYDRNKPDGEKKLTEWVKKLWERPETIPMAVDVALGNRFSVQGLNRLFQAAKMCMDSRVRSRPTMRVVEAMVREAAVPQVPEMTRHSI